MLTREEVERIENTLQRNLSDFEIHGGMVRYWVSINDAKRLLREYQAVVDERDALAAEGRLRREALEAHVFHCEIDGQRKSYCEGDYWCSRCSDGDACAVLTIPSLISAEVKRVRRLEAVLEAAEALIDDRSAHIEGCVPLKNAIAAYREGERPGREGNVS